MSDTNYTPDEVRLLDEFAKAWLHAECSSGGVSQSFEDWAIDSYSTAEAMIAERRKRLPQAAPQTFPWPPRPPFIYGPGSVQGTPKEPDEWAKPMDTATNIYPQPKCGKCGVAFQPNEPRITHSDRFGTEHVSCHPTPPAEQPADAEVTRLNRALANGTDDLRAADAATTQARRERDEARAELRLIRQTLRITDEQPISAWLRAHEMTSQAWADKCRQAEAELAEAQPVLDAVVQCHSGATPFMHSIAAGKLLDAYADRRRAQQAKQDGGA